VGQTVAQWRRSCWWKKPGVQAACTDRSRVPDTRRVPVRSRGSRTFVQIETGGFYPRFYGVYWQSVPQSDCNWKEGLTARTCIALDLICTIILFGTFWCRWEVVQQFLFQLIYCLLKSKTTPLVLKSACRL